MHMSCHIYVILDLRFGKNIIFQLRSCKCFKGPMWYMYITATIALKCSEYYCMMSCVFLLASTYLHVAKASRVHLSNAGGGPASKLFQKYMKYR